MLAARQLAVTRSGHVVFRGIDLSLAPGQVMAVVGPNGSGKTTLLRVLAGLLRPAAGALEWQGQPVGAGHAGYCQALGYVGHAAGMAADLSATEHLVYAGQLAGMRATAAQARAVLEDAGLGRVADVPARMLSEGQQRRVALARLGLIPRRLWLLDEPLASLDASATATFLRRLAAHCASGGMAVIATHAPLPPGGGIPLSLRLGDAA
ncbi:MULTISPECIES: cytochrome c biogenesis heme-transporting ATPase CcmA [unclassified Cupriavidus]|uniref:cytochrome c biogenesis heme-transporting ATPase CcmA n=1 Tax=Cupriavidus sp. H19C3 TaxID=3241603 RepID=UPI003BF7D025